MRAFRLGQFAKAARLLTRVVRLDGALRAQAQRYLSRIPARFRTRATGRGAPARMKKKNGGGRSPKPARAAAGRKKSATPPQPSPEGAVVRRTPHMEIDSPPPIARGSTLSVDVFADTAARTAEEDSEPIALRGRPGQTRFELDVWLAGSAHFHVEEPKSSTLVIDAATDRSTRAHFTVSVVSDLTQDGLPTLTAYFFHNGRPCGKVSRQPRVGTAAASRAAEAAGAAPPAARGSLAIDASARPPDLTVEITDPTRNRRSLQCRITTPLLPVDKQPPISDWYLPEESAALVGQFMKEFVKPDISPRARVLSLKGAGYALYEASPKAFKDTLWALIDAGTPPRSILVVSEEPFIPWELMVPRRRGTVGEWQERAALGVEFAVGRWIHEEYLAPPQHVPLVDSFVVAPAYEGARPKPLRFAPQETELVLKAVAGDAIEPADLASIDDRVQAGRSLLHFVCHGADSPGVGIQVIHLAGGETLSSLQIAALKGMAAAGRKKPLIFLNACEVGRPNVALVGIGGFAKAFVDMGAAGVIAPLWSVRDSIAFDVAARFYAELGQQPARSFADILRAIRNLAYDEQNGEDTYAAYCFYGDPAAARG